MFGELMMAELDGVVEEMPESLRPLLLDMLTRGADEGLLAYFDLGVQLTERDRAALIVTALVGAVAESRARAAALAGAVAVVAGAEVAHAAISLAALVSDGDR